VGRVRRSVHPWHPGHITERYGLFTIIVLGEVISAIAIAVQSALAAGGVAGPGLLLAAAGGLLLVFALWWSYFKHSAITQIRQSLPWTFVWALGHYLVFSAVAAVGAGLQVVVDTLTHADHVGSVFAAFTVAIPVAVFLVVLGLLNTRMTDQPTAIGPILLTAVPVLAAAATTRIVTLPLSIVIMMVLVALLLAYHLAAAHRTALMIKS
jgi:low temperature requirement protein LtrA